MSLVTSLSQLDPNGTYSYADYLSWQIDQALEVIKGKIMPMAGPSRTHQKISWQMSGTLFNYFKDRACEAYAAPFDVRLYDRRKSEKADKDIFTVVQPDLCVVCDGEKLDERGCLGAPDLVVEILSPGNSSREMKLKKDLYAETGVREYWIIDPIHETVAQYTVMSEGNYDRPLIFVSNEVLVSVIFPGLILTLGDLFPPTKLPLSNFPDDLRL